MTQILIKIDEDTYNNFVRNRYSRTDVIAIHTALVNGILLPKKHGKIVDIGKIDEDRIDDNNPIIYHLSNGEYIESVSLNYLNSLPTIIGPDELGDENEKLG